MPGSVIPWVTLWSDEVVDPRMVRLVPSVDGLTFEDQRPDDRFSGVLWNRQRNAPGGGKPLYAQVHSARQWQCARRLMCQVCGTKLPRDVPVPWIVPAYEYAMMTDQTLSRVLGRLTLPGRIPVVVPQTTMAPPTCETCWPVAEKLCPHLRDYGSVRFRVDTVTPWGVFGDLHHPLRSAMNQEVPLSSDLKRHMLAKQLIVHLSGIREVKV